jgi:hypothetical protein
LVVHHEKCGPKKTSNYCSGLRASKTGIEKPKKLGILA